MRETLRRALDEIFTIYGGHEWLSSERIADELARQWELLESGKTDIPPISETY